MKTLVLVMATALSALAQQAQLPFSEIPSTTEKYTAGTVAARFIDGLGFRYHWATEGLRAEDLAFKPSAESRSTLETLTHIYEMSAMIKNATMEKVNEAGQSPALSFNEMRKVTLENFKAASDILKRSTDNDLTRYALKFKQGEHEEQFPFWNVINGPIED
jgi:hypothetical protein